MKILKPCSVKTVGAGLLANAVGQSPNSSTDPPHSRASPLPQLDLHTFWISITSGRSQSALEKNSVFDPATQVGYQAAVLLILLLILILGTPLTTMAARRHAETERGTEWWGEDLLVTFGWAGFRAFAKSDPL
ncbi:hypothetical protein [Pseudomonas antarctica]|uniref:hypothetical protein n=1 Tax=Pseudomonas antarctica TaxID=219572 RepID=UPI003F756E52